MPRRKGYIKARILNARNAGRNGHGRFEMDLNLLIDLHLEKLLFEIVAESLYDEMDDEWYRQKELDELYTEASDDDDDNEKDEEEDYVADASVDALLRLVWTNAAILHSGDGRWKAKGANINIRGAGTSERTFYGNHSCGGRIGIKR